MLKRIAVTGGIASGKSTVCHVFQELGAYVVSADSIVHQLLTLSTVSKQVIKLLGNQVVKDGKIDKQNVSRLVFANPDLLLKLEALLHPLVFRAIKDEFQKAKKGGFTLFVAEVPLLFEAKFDVFFDETVAVIADESACKERFSNDYTIRMKHQFAPNIKAQKATYVIENLGSLDELKTKATNLFSKISPKK